MEVAVAVITLVRRMHHLQQVKQIRVVVEVEHHSQVVLLLVVVVLVVMLMQSLLRCLLLILMLLGLLELLGQPVQEQGLEQEQPVALG
jgi:hypothetical protein